MPSFANDLDLYPLIMGNMYAKFDEDTLDTLLSTIFTRLLLHFPNMTLTFDPENQKRSSSVINNTCAIFDQNILKHFISSSHFFMSAHCDLDL